MSVKQALVDGMVKLRGTITYSMYGSRDGSDGTGDCSGIMSRVLKEAGIPIQGLPSTVTLGQQLAKNGFYRVSRNQDWDAETGDIVLMSWGADMSSSGGAGGHVGVMMDSVNFISCDYSTQGAVGQAINTYPWNDYYSANKPSYIEVWRYSDSAPQTNNKANTAVAPQEKAYYEANEVKYVNGIWQIKCDYLTPIGFDWITNGIPVTMVNWVDKDGNDLPDGADQEFKAGMFFSFAGNEVNITDTGSGGYYGGYYWRLFEFGQFGPVWLSCWNKDDLVNYYK
ncbi:peptidoglycan hydrolase [Streptococcus thermophilus]|uniref:lytic exoenzyme target recognition domain-containing protein n=1 Tax=Streptococcus thermophilus TaxID=1308 RepID=UPI0022EA562A|nr:lytic exoenzyme target recognition domain-containing protein [Streptococcus thermophilus]MDA3773986.1 peptidoglycan hydrolase [Streptococcus thermophilus]